MAQKITFTLTKQIKLIATRSREDLSVIRAPTQYSISISHYHISDNFRI